jgi:indolepyruvate ferredoxin oxidoreductase
MDTGIAVTPGDYSTVTLESRFTDFDTPVLLTGIQALVRILLEQKRLDLQAGLNTGGFVSGYRGSPLGGLDRELWKRQKLLSSHNIQFQPGLNEDMAATMIYGTQQLDAFPGAKVDGVFGMWYGKGPGVDRTADAFRCANFMGTSKHGGVLAVSGDDHAAHSSTYPHQTDHIFQGVMIPVLNPASAQDVFDFGLAGIALSRYSGLWTALKTTAETAEQAATIRIPDTWRFVTPDHPLPAHGLNVDFTLRHPADRAELERRVVDERLPAVGPWVRANNIDRLISGTADATIGIVTVGRAHFDAMHALASLELTDHPMLAVHKIGLTWPIDADGIRDFARGKRLLIVVEEKRSFVEAQIREALYNMRADDRPDIVGKTDLAGAKLFPATMELSPEIVGGGLSHLLRGAGLNVAAPPSLPSPDRPAGLLRRAPAFCAGCPHGTSTQLPEGSFASAGIGCHFMALDESNQTRTFTQMGGEGGSWVGMSGFTDIPHLFANIGDGTYTHSGLLAIRQAVAAKARMTYKILYNDAVAMTGGQPAEAGYTVTQIAAQVHAEGISRIALVADDEDRLPPASALPPGTTRHTREEMDKVQRELREYDGLSVLIYDQVCATEKRRRRKSGKYPEAAISVVINEKVCENCGDCSKQSSCIAIEPIETDLGRKRRINPSSCNVDLSCLKGFCPSFVTIAGPPKAPGADPRWKQREAEFAAGLAEPARAAMPWRGLFAGIGGGGVVTSGAILAMAAQLEGHQVSTLDFAGLAQKNGAVVSHVQISDDGSLDVVRIPFGTANFMLAADLAVAAGAGVLERCAPTAAVLGNLDLAATAEFKRDANLNIDAGLHRRVIERTTGAKVSSYLHGVQLAERLFGNAQAMNTLYLGLAYQRGLLPVTEAALHRSIELNGAALELNRRAFLWGRILAAKPELVREILGDAEPAVPQDLDGLIALRAAALSEYQNAAYATLYRQRVGEIVARETSVFGKPGKLSRKAAEGWFRVMAYKDEYEVARIHASSTYGKNPVFHLSPPVIARMDPLTGRRKKIGIPGRFALPLFRLLRHGKALRGTAFDPFAWQAERKWERGLIAQYEADMREVLAGLRPETQDVAVMLADLPDSIRGFGPVKEANYKTAMQRRDSLLAQLRNPPEMRQAAE